jgi:8-oxo-dGTP pyrophosphatase MutT (NUDIX family)
MTRVDNLWYLGNEAVQVAEQTYHRLSEQYDGYIEYGTTKQVSRDRFRTVAQRIKDNGLPYGAHTIPYTTDGQILLVRHEPIDLWVLPGGEAVDDEGVREAAERELAEEAGIEASYDGLGLLGRVRFESGGHSTWGVLPIYEASTEATEPTVQDPDGEISRAAWFDDLPDDTRDRQQLLRWRERRLDS